MSRSSDRSSTKSSTRSSATSAGSAGSKPSSGSATPRAVGRDRDRRQTRNTVAPTMPMSPIATSAKATFFAGLPTPTWTRPTPDDPTGRDWADAVEPAEIGEVTGTEETPASTDVEGGVVVGGLGTLSSTP